MGFNGATNDKFLRVFHEIVEENTRKELALKGFRFPLPINTKDAKVSPLHVIFDLKGVLVGKEYFKINHFLPPPFHLAQGHTY